MSRENGIHQLLHISHYVNDRKQKIEFEWLSLTQNSKTRPKPRFVFYS